VGEGGRTTASPPVAARRGPDLSAGGLAHGHLAGGGRAHDGQLGEAVTAATGKGVTKKEKNRTGHFPLTNGSGG
jgi:hypothetical protein